MEDEEKPLQAPAFLPPADPRPGTEVSPDYVTLSGDVSPQCSRENPYICERERGVDGRTAKDPGHQWRGSPSADGGPLARTDFVNGSYLPLAEPVDTSRSASAPGPGNLYSNLPRS